MKAVTILSSEISEQRALQALGAGQSGEALMMYTKLLKDDPTNITFIYNLGSAYLLEGNYVKALEYFDKVIEKQSDCYSAYYNMGLCHIKLANYKIAADCFKKAHEGGYRERPDMYMFWGKAYKALGKFEFAEQAFVAAYNLSKLPEAIACLGYTRKHTDQDSDIFKVTRQLIEDNNTSDEDKRNLLFSMGKMLEDCKCYDEAFSYYQKANELVSKLPTTTYQMDDFENEIRGIKKIFTNDFIQSMQQKEVKDFIPIFIIGMPRSGTTVTEQILASHSQVYSAGESRSVTAIVRESMAMVQEGEKNYPEHIQELTFKQFGQLQAKYVDIIQKKNSSNKPFVINKMPDNYIYMGLIKILFPNAIFIHCMRHPLDTCLSMYFTNFERTGLHYANFTQMTRYYKCYHRLMKFWKENIAIAMHDTVYDHLIDDTTNQIKNLLSHCNLDWEDSCDEFYTHERSITTASSWQARQPVYGTSKDKWKNYTSHIKALTAGLDQEINHYESIAAENK